MREVQETRYPDEYLLKKMDGIMRDSLQKEIVKWKKENTFWVSTLEFFLEKKWIQDNIDSYILDRSRGWLNWFRTELGPNVWKQMYRNRLNKMSRSPHCFKDYVSDSFVFGNELELHAEYIYFLDHVITDNMTPEMEKRGHAAL